MAFFDQLNLEIVNVEDDTEQFFGSISVPIESFLECSEPTEERFLTEIVDDFRRFVDEIWRF